MKVAIDTGSLSDGHAVRGIGKYTRELVKALQKENKRVKDFKLATDNYDLVHYPYFDLFFHTLPIIKITKTVVTIHDVIPLIYPDHYPPGVKGKINFYLQKLALKNVDAVVTDTETSKKDIERFMGLPQEKIHLVYLAPAKIFKRLEVQKKYKLPNKFVLYVGDVNYNKNILGLVEACKIAKIPLVIVGKQALETNYDKDHIENLPLRELQERYGNDKDVIRLGFLHDEDLVSIYNLATVYCQPSFYEGFGLPVLEAMACGCPVVAAKTQALVEIAEGAAIFADPKNPEDIASKLKEVIGSLSIQFKYKKLGLEHVKKFSWEKTAKLTLDVYKKVFSRQ